MSATSPQEPTATGFGLGIADPSSGTKGAPTEAVRFARTIPAKARALVALTKPRIVELLLITTIPTTALASSGIPNARLLVATLGGGALAAGGANAFNMVIDRDIDARMMRTQKRPLVTGALRPSTAVAFAFLLEISAFVVLWLECTLLAAAVALGAAAFYVIIYTGWLKRSTTQNIVIGGAAGAAPPLVAWAAVTGSIAPAAWALFAVIVLWTPPHFWALAVRYRDDYASVDVPMLPAVANLQKVANQILAYTALTVVASLTVSLAAGSRLGPVYLFAAVVLGAAFIAKALRFRTEQTPKSAMQLFHFSIAYLAILFLAVGIGAVVPW